MKTKARTNTRIKKYEVLEHTLDLKMRFYGVTTLDLFTNAAKGMVEYLYGKEVFSLPETQMVQIELTAIDKLSLLVEWLSELLYLGETQKRANINCEIREINDSHIVAMVGSCEADALRNIKAVTYHDLAVEEKDGHWEAQVAFDI